MKTAFLVLDIQKGIINRLSSLGNYVPRLEATVNSVRCPDIQIIHVTTAWRPGCPDLHPRNPTRASVVDYNAFVEGSDAVASAISVDPADIVVTKRRVSAFSASDLDLVLRSSGIEHVVITGLITSGAVLSTVRQAADLDYRLTVLRDLCEDRDEDVHRLLMDKVIPKQAAVMDSDSWLSTLGDD